MPACIVQTCCESKLFPLHVLGDDTLCHATGGKLSGGTQNTWNSDCNLICVCGKSSEDGWWETEWTFYYCSTLEKKCVLLFRIKNLISILPMSLLLWTNPNVNFSRSSCSQKRDLTCLFFFIFLYLFVCFVMWCGT